MAQWPDETVPVMRHETHFGNRVVRCFVERPSSLHGLLSDAVAANGDGDALVCGAVRFSYRELDAEVGRVAAGLAAFGIGRGDRVAMLLGNRVEFVITVLAAARLGAISVPLSILDQQTGIRHALTDSGARLLVFETSRADRLPPPAETPELIHRLGDAGDSSAPAYADLRRHGTLTDAAAVGEEDVAAILYTSGTTGAPKGAMLTHLGIAHSVMHYRACMGLTQTDRTVTAVPLSHVTGLVALMASALGAAGTLILMPSFKAPEFLALAARERMTHTILVPAMYKLCLMQPDFDAYDLSAWRIGGYGGAPMPAVTISKLGEKLPRLQLMNAYGATETTSPVTIMPAAATAARADSVGLPVPCADLLVMDDDGREVPPGEPGEVWVRGPMVVPAYWNNAEATANAFVAGHWRSGDIGSMDEEGFLRILDRKKDIINRGGYKIPSIEVENALVSHPDIVEAAVVARPCAVLGERVHAFVVAARPDVATEDLRTVCAAVLSDYKVPESFTFRQAPLPRNANGKVIKSVLRQDVLQETAPEDSPLGVG